MSILHIYYLQILLPLPLLVWAGLTLCTLFFAATLIIYMFYRMVTDANKLINSGAVSTKDQWQLFTPFVSFKYFKQLYLK